MEKQIAKCGKQVSKDALKKTFRYININMSGHISANEFYLAMADLPVPLSDTDDRRCNITNLTSALLVGSGLTEALGDASLTSLPFFSENPSVATFRSAPTSPAA